MATTKSIRAVEILIATAVAGVVVKEGAVLLVPEDVSEDNARALMRMTRKRAKEAEGDKLKARLAKLAAKAKEAEEAAAKAKEAEEAAAKAKEAEEAGKGKNGK